MIRSWRHARLGLIGLFVLASCFHGPVPTATLAPASADAVARSKGPFAVVYAAPQGRVLDRKQPGVTVLFSRAVRSVETAAEEKLPPVTIATRSGNAVPGAWRWTGTRGLLFTPEVELPGGSDFVVSVPPSVTALDGTALGKPFTLSLETDGPKVDLFTAGGPPGVTEHALPNEPTFRLQFDQGVDPGAVHAAATLRVYGADGDRGGLATFVASREPATARPPPSSLPQGSHVVPESYVVLLKPDKPLPLDHQVELTVGAVRGTGGPRPMTEPFSRVMRTHGGLHFVDFYCPRIEAKGRCKAKGDVKVVLSNPVPPDELKRHVRLGTLPPRPPAKPGKKGDKRAVDPSVEHWLGVAPALGESYKVTLTAGMQDIYGGKLDKDATFDLVVEANLTKPVAPALATAASVAPEPIGKPRRPPSGADESRPHRERLPYQLDLGLVGHILEAGGNHKLPVGAVNVPTYATLATPLTDAQATAWTILPGHTQEFVARNGLVSSWTTTHAEVNERTVQFIDLDAALAKNHGRGPALIVLSPPGTMSGNGSPTESLVSVTDLGVSAKMSPFGSLVWVTQLSSAKPVTGAKVTLRTAKGGDVFEAATDAQGLVVVPADRFDPLTKEKNDDGEGGGEGARVRSDAAILVRAGDDWTVTRVAVSPVERRLTSGFEVLSKEGRWAGMLFADRGVFRPGETAKVSGIVRVAEGDGLRSIPDRDVRIELKDGNGEQLFDGRAKCDAFGSFAVDVPIPKTAPIGVATMTATALPGGKSNTSGSGVFSHEIRVLAYKPNEFKVTVEADKPAYVRGDTAVFSTHGEYLYGAPMAGASVTTTVARQEVPFVPTGAEGFTTTDDVSTGDYPDDTKAAAEVDSQDGTLDPKGSFNRKVSLAFDNQRRPERVVFDADVQDLSRRDVSGRTGVIVHPGEFYVSLRLPKDRFVAAGALETVEVAAIEPGGVRRGGVRVKVELVERRWNSVTGEQPDGRPKKTSKPEDTVVTACDASTVASPPASSGRCNLRVPRAGYFIVRATATDPRGNTVRASTSIYGTEESPKAQSSWEADDRHAIKLEANKKKYGIGESARVLLRSPFKEGQALVTVERNGVLYRNVVPIKGPVPVVDIPIKPEFYPNAFVSVVAIRGRVQAPPATGADLGGPDYRLGWTELTIDQDAHRLVVGVTEPKAEYQPGTMADADVLVKDQSGKPVQTSLTFYVVDEGVLALTSYVTPDPLPAFVQPRKLSVFTFDNREALGHVVPMKAGERLSPLGYEYALSRNTDGSYDKGDDGGDGAGTRRADFRTTVYFEAGHKTDAAGKAHFSFKLPDNLTTFRVMAVAAAADDRFGSGESKVTTYRRLMARPALPRLIRVGDALEASVIVSSRDDTRRAPHPDDKAATPMQVLVKLDVKGLTSSGPNTRSITMLRGGQAEVRFPVKATHAGEALLSFDVRSGSDVDRVDIKRTVELPVSVESAVVYGETSGQAAVALGDLTTMRPDFGGLDVRVASSALVGLGLTVDRLTEYPYGCTEQVTSKLLPLLSAMELARTSGAHVPQNDVIDADVETLLKRQNSDGGFGFWDKSSSEPWLSAYAMLAVAGASEKKRFVPRDVLEQGRSYLNFSLANFTRKFAKPTHDAEDTETTARPDAGTSADAEEKRESEATSRVLDYVSASLVGDTLATLGWPNPGALNVLYDARVGSRLFAKAALLHAMARAEMSGPQVKDLTREVLGRLRIGPDGVDIDEDDDDRYSPVLDSHARTLAMVLRALLATNPKHALGPRLARTLLALRRNGAWRTTQEDTWALLALADYRRLQEAGSGAIEVQTSLGGSDLLLSKFARGATREDQVFVSTETLIRRGPSLSFDVRGGSPAFYSAELKYRSTTLPTRPRDEGLFVTKYVRSVEPAAVTEALAHIPRQSAGAVNAGDLVLVDLLFESAEPREHVVIDDPLPAGLEALDYDLDTTSQAARDAVEKHEADPRVEWLGTTFRSGSSHREVRDDRVVTFFDAIKPGMYRVHYLARATSIGSFVVPPTRASAMYSPEVYGSTAASTLTVRPKP